MKFTDIDYFAEYGNSLLNKIPTRVKLFFVALVIAAVVFSKNIYLLGGLYTALLLIILTTKVPKLHIIKASLYPLIFLLLFLFSVRGLTLEFTLILVFKALSSSTALILLFFTTSFVKIFTQLRTVLPAFVVNMLFMTYRSIFILARTLENLLNTLKFRGKPSIKNIGNLLGFFVIKSIQTGENMYDAMKLRGYDDKKTAG